METSDSNSSHNLTWLRSVADMVTCFIMAVMLLRGFVLEGYLISTGSMAPHLRGFHKRIVCPSCGHIFAFGISFDESVSVSDMTATRSDGSEKTAVCPNCGQANIDVSAVPNSHGDQLLVQKHVYDFRRPKRWETIVFRNPAAPEEAYVKRVTGLPGESLQVIDGDIYINGTIARKPWPVLQEMRIPVCELNHLVDSEDWQMPWEADVGWDVAGGRLQTMDLSDDLSSAPATVSSDDPPETMQWITFRYWLWSGGDHFSETPLSPQSAGGEWEHAIRRFSSVPVSWISRLDYDRDREVLRCEGVMPQGIQQDLLNHADNAEFRNAIFRLAARSHLAPVTDQYGYNALISARHYRVRDLSLHAVLGWHEAPAMIQVDVPCEGELFQVRLMPEKQLIELYSVDHDLVLESTTFETRTVPPAPGDTHAENLAGVELDASAIDGQVVVAVNGNACFEPFIPRQSNDSGRILPSNLDERLAPSIRASQDALLVEQQQQWRLGVTGAGVQVVDLQMYRDVYYTPGRERNGIREPYPIPRDCYFVQGDNSPVSSDSRSWGDPCVPHRLLVGKPFVVHLPSRPAILQLGSRDILIRIPDWKRIRYIH
ncbi:MAG: signal peptidase I [Planctomycetaceae bacterium]|nr:signal peptidase I [Planctomycetaceae bacterium]